MAETTAEQTNNVSFHCGWVAVMGPPNAGKSTLLNAIIGQKVSIVTPKPQTTRTQIVGILTEKDAQVIFIDTPGMADLRGHLNKTMTQAIWLGIDQANIILLVLDAQLYIQHPGYFEKDLTPLIEALSDNRKPMFVAVNKIDTFSDKSKLLPLLTKINQTWPNAELFPVSAQTKEGVDELVKAITEKLPEAPAQFPEDQLSTASLRFMAAEIVREKLFLALRQEVPYGVAVEVTDWEENKEKNLTVIKADIYVAKPMYKAMIIGKNGEGIKAIGTQARKDIEDLLNTKVYLELFVKVRENWMNDPSFVRELNQHSNQQS